MLARYQIFFCTKGYMTVHMLFMASMMGLAAMCLVQVILYYYIYSNIKYLKLLGLLQVCNCFPYNKHFKTLRMFGWQIVEGCGVYIPRNGIICLLLGFRTHSYSNILKVRFNRHVLGDLVPTQTTTLLQGRIVVKIKSINNNKTQQENRVKCMYEGHHKVKTVRK